MFETLNDRGVRTTQADLVKNYLFAQAGERIDEAQQKWARMNGSLEALQTDDMVLTYMRHLMISLDGHTTEKEVLSKIKEKASGTQQAVGFLEIMAQNAITYVAVQTPNHVKWNNYAPGLAKHIEILGVLQVTPMRPLMLAVAHKFSKKQTEKAFKQFVSWSVRYLISGGLRSGTVEQGIAAEAKEVSEGNTTTAKQLAAKMSKILPTDQRFKDTFSTARVSKHALARYLLRSLELHRRGDPEPEMIPNDSAEIVNLEHVLPENPDQNWPEFDPSIQPVYYTRLGNMVLLKSSENSSIGNKGFTEKRIACG